MENNCSSCGALMTQLHNCPLCGVEHQECTNCEAERHVCTPEPVVLEAGTEVDMGVGTTVLPAAKTVRGKRKKAVEEPVEEPETTE